MRSSSVFAAEGEVHGQAGVGSERDGPSDSYRACDHDDMETASPDGNKLDCVAEPGEGEGRFL